MRIEAGKLDRRLELITRTMTRDSMGDAVEASSTSAVAWGQRLELRTQDAARAGGREAFTLARFLIRYRDDITTALRVRVDQRLFDIVAVDEPDRRATLILTLEEVTRQ